MDISFQIVGVDETLGSVQVIYYPSAVAKVDGQPEWFIGPYNIDLPVDDAGIFPSGGELRTYISNSCPVDMVEREVKIRAQVSREMDAQRAEIGIEYLVVQTSPVVEGNVEEFPALEIGSV